MPEPRCEVHDDPASFLAAIGDGGSDSRYFNHPAWVELVWQRMEAPRGSRFAGLVVRHDGAPVAWWPLILSRRSLGFRLQNLGQEISDYATPHVEPAHAAHTDTLFSAMLEAVRGLRRRYAYLQWQQFLPPEGIGLPPDLAPGPRLSHGWKAGAPRDNFFIECGPFAGDPDAWFSQRLSRNVRKNLRHEHNVLKRQGELALVALPDHTSLAPLRDPYFSWYRHGLANSSARQLKLDIWWSFYEAQVAGLLDASRLNVGGRCASLIFGFRRGGEYDLFSLAFDPELAEFSPGKQHLVLLIQREIARGTTRFNFLAGDEAYKRQFATDSYPTWDLHHTHPGNLSALLPWAKAYLKTMRDN